MTRTGARSKTASRSGGQTPPWSMPLAALGPRPLECQLTADRQAVPFLRERVELRLHRYRRRSSAPLVLELRNELFRTPPLREPDLLDPVLPPDLHRLFRVDGDEELRLPPGGERPEDAVVQAEFRLGDEVQEVVREPVVVAGRRLCEQVGRPVTTDVHAVVTLLLDEPDLH